MGSCPVVRARLTRGCSGLRAARCSAVVRFARGTQPLSRSAVRPLSMNSRAQLWLLAIVQTVATASILLATAEVKVVVWQTFHLRETRAPHQMPLPLFIVFIAAPIAVAVIATVRRAGFENLWVWFAVLFLLTALAGSVQTMGALHLWAERAARARG
jgi:hypothetical protein